MPFAAHLTQGTRAPRTAGPVIAAPQSDWSAAADRLIGRIKAAVLDALAVDHVGSTAIPGLPAKDVIDLQLAVKDLQTADRIAPLLAAVGFPAVPGVTGDTPKPSHPDPAGWQKRFHANADPGRPVNLHVRVAGSPGWRYALMFRDWLRADPEGAPSMKPTNSSSLTSTPGIQARTGTRKRRNLGSLT